MRHGGGHAVRIQVPQVHRAAGQQRVAADTRRERAGCRLGGRLAAAPGQRRVRQEKSGEPVDPPGETNSCQLTRGVAAAAPGPAAIPPTSANSPAIAAGARRLKVPLISFPCWKISHYT